MTDVCPICKTERAEGEPSCHICGHRNPAPDPGNAPTRQQPSLTGMRTVQRVNVSTFLILELAPLGIALLAAWAFMAQGAASSGGTYIEVFGQRRVFSASGGFITATVLAGGPLHAPSPRQLGTTNGLLVQGTNFGFFLGAPVTAWAVAASGSWQATQWVILACAVAGLAMALILRGIERRLVGH